MNRRASIFDWFYIIVIIFMTGICVFTAHIIITAADNSGLFQDTDEAQEAVNITKNTILSFDNLLLFAIIGLSIFVIISAAMVFNHPAMLVISFVLLCIAVVFAAMVSNSFWDFANSTQITAYQTAFPKIIFLMNNLPIYIGAMGLLGLAAAFVGANRQ